MSFGDYYTGMGLRARTDNNTKFTLPLILMGLMGATVMFYNPNTSTEFALLFILSPSVIIFYQLYVRVKSSQIPIYTYPTFWLVVSILLIFLIAPFFAQFSSDNSKVPFPDWNWQDTYGSTLMLGSVAIFSLALSECNLGSNPIPLIKIEANKSSLRYIWILFWITYGMLGYAYWTQTQGGVSSVFLNRIQRQQIGLKFTNGYLYDSLLVITGVLTAILAHRRCQGKLKFGVIEFYIFLTMIPYVTRGDRSVFLYTLTVVFVIYGLTSKKRPNYLRFMIPTILLIPLLIVAPRLYRHSELPAFSAIKQSFSLQNLSRTFTGLDTAMVPALTILRSQMGKEIQYQYGKSYLGAIVRPVPRAVWSSKPIEIDRQLNEQLFPKTSKQVGFAFSGISEPFVNFGIFGVIAFFFLMGKISSSLANFSGGVNARRVLLIAWVSGFMFVLIRGNLTTDFQRLLFPLIPGLMVLRMNPKQIPQ